MHRVMNKSIEELDLNYLMDGKKAHIFYSDPPWNNGNLKYWATLNKKQTGKSYKPITFEKMIFIIKHIIDNYVKGYVFLEVGKNQTDYVKSQLTDVLYNVQVQSLRYKSGNTLLENKIIIGTKNPEFYFNKDVSHYRGIQLPMVCINRVSKEGEIVLDPFCGMGYTAQAALNSKMIFYGNEFNSLRLSKTKRRLGL